MGCLITQRKIDCAWKNARTSGRNGQRIRGNIEAVGAEEVSQDFQKYNSMMRNSPYAGGKWKPERWRPLRRPYGFRQQASWGKCSQTWMNGFCCKSCPNSCGGSRKPAAPKPRPMNKPRSNGNDNPPPNTRHTCKQQASWGKCSQTWMKGFCCKSCSNSCEGSRKPTAPKPRPTNKPGSNGNDNPPPNSRHRL